MRHLLALVAAGACLASAAGVHASSHREAPFITENPKVDGTDFYMFRSYETGREGFVTLIANYVPLQDAYGGPNYFALDPEALYEIHVDNDGDAVEDITFAFDFDTAYAPLKIGGVSIPLVVSGPVTSATDADILVKETFTVAVVRDGRRSGNRSLVTNPSPLAGDAGTAFRKPLDNIGAKTFPDYAAYASSHVRSINVPGCATSGGKVFVGQRREGFVVNLGEVFDLINTNPFGARDGESNTIADKNVVTIALEVPAACLTAGDPVIGAWTTASLRQTRVLNPRPEAPVTARPGTTGPSIEGGAYTQVSRLGMPLVNEVVIGLDSKDRFNASRPAADLTNFASFVTTPTLPVLVDLLFNDGGGELVPSTPRNDLVAAFVTGIRTSVNGTQTNFTQPAAIAAGTGTPGEMLRLNTAFPTALDALPPTPAATGDLGFLSCNTDGLNGFPNGRRVTDDVVDIALSVAMGAIHPDNPNALQTCDVSGMTPTPAGTAGKVVTDGARPDPAEYLTVFPYLNVPLAGSPASSPVL